MRADSVIFLSRALSLARSALMIEADDSLPPLRDASASETISFGIDMRLAVAIAWLSPGMPSSTLYVGRPLLSSNSIDALSIPSPV